MAKAKGLAYHAANIAITMLVIGIVVYVLLQSSHPGLASVAIVLTYIALAVFIVSIVVLVRRGQRPGSGL